MNLGGALPERFVAIIGATILLIAAAATCAARPLRETMQQDGRTVIATFTRSPADAAGGQTVKLYGDGAFDLRAAPQPGRMTPQYIVRGQLSAEIFQQATAEIEQTQPLHGNYRVLKDTSGFRYTLEANGRQIEWDQSFNPLPQPLQKLGTLLDEHVFAHHSPATKSSEQHG